jgi:putative glutamine amidotransferase
MSFRPVIGITPDTANPNDAERMSPRERFRYESPATYSRAVAAAGGTPFILPYHLDCIPHYLALCHGFILSGGDDPDLSSRGLPNHPQSKIMHPLRQSFEFALLQALDTTDHPVLGICLGMQLMALHHGGTIHQHLPDAPTLSPDQAASHLKRDHLIDIAHPHPALPASPRPVYSHHHQAVASPGKLRILATSDQTTGSVIEAIDLPPTPPPTTSASPSPAPRFYLGVQWHPERTADAATGQHIIDALVRAAASRHSV